MTGIDCEVKSEHTPDIEKKKKKKENERKKKKREGKREIMSTDKGVVKRNRELAINN